MSLLNPNEENSADTSIPTEYFIDCCLTGKTADKFRAIKKQLRLKHDDEVLEAIIDKAQSFQV